MSRSRARTEGSMSVMRDGLGLPRITRATGERLTSGAGRRAGTRRTPGSVLIAAAAWLLALTGSGALFVSFSAQYAYMDRDTYHARLTELRQWADAVLCQHYGGYELRDCWPRHIHVVWELSTLATEWHRTYSSSRPDLARALEFYDRWLPNTMRRIAGMTRACMTQCVMLRRPGDTAYVRRR